MEGGKQKKIIKYFYDVIYPTLREETVRVAPLIGKNAYGCIQRRKYWQDGEVFESLPVICGHGGSMWLCAECAERMAG